MTDNLAAVRNADGTVGLIDRHEAEKRVRAGSMIKRGAATTAVRAGASSSAPAPPPPGKPAATPAAATVQVSAEQYRQLRANAGVAEPEEYAPGEAWPAGWMPDVSRRMGVEF